MLIFNKLFTAGANLSEYSLHYKNNDQDGSLVPSGVAGTFDFVADPIAGSSRNCLKMTITNADAPTYGGIRAEIIPYIDRSASVQIATPREAWIAFEVMIPRTLAVWQDTTPNPLVVFQLHDSPDVGDAVRSPTLHAYLDQGTPRRISISNTYDATDPSTSTSFTEEVVGSIATPSGQWTSVVIHIDQQHDASGVLEVWINGRQIINKVGPTAANDAVMGHIKGGLYDYDHVGTLGTRTLYHSGFVVGDASESLASMLAALNSRAPAYARSTLTAQI